MCGNAEPGRAVLPAGRSGPSHGRAGRLEPWSDGRRQPLGRRVLSGIGAGALGGAAFGAVEGTWVLGTGESLPLELVAVSAAAAILIGAGFGAFAGLVSSSRRRAVGLWVFLSLASVMLAVPEVRPLVARAGGILPAVVLLIATVWAGFLSLEPGSLFRSPPGAPRLVVAGMAAGALVVLADLNSRVLPDMLSVRSLVVNLGQALVTLSLLLLIDRWLAVLADGGRGWARRSLAAVLAVALGWSLLLATWGGTRPGRSLDRPAVRPARGAAAASVMPARGTAPAPVMPAPAAGAAALEPRPDVILMVLDTARTDVLTPYGAPPELTPALAAFAEEAVVYRRAIAPSSWTLPSHATLLTGLYPEQHGAGRARAGGPALELGDLSPAAPLRAGLETLATLAEAAGYRTGAVLANSGYLHPEFGLERGFQRYTARPRMVLRREPLALPLLQWSDPDYVSRLTRWCREADDIFAEALDWLEARPGTPAFLMVNLMEPHDPYVPSPPYDRRPGRRPALVDPYAEVLRGRRSVTPEEQAHLRAGYEGSVQGMDASIGRFFEALRRRARFDQALIVVVSDHGETFGEHGMMRHARELWEPLIRVPLMVRYPEGRSRGVVDLPVHLVDVAPTVARLAGLEPMAAGLVPPIAGRVLPLPGEEGEALDGLGMADRPLLAGVQPSREDVARFGERWNREVACLYDGALKYCETSQGERRLFDLEVDPGEERNLVSSRPGDAARLAVALLEVRARLSGAVPSGGGEISPEALEQLRALGYVR